MRQLIGVAAVAAIIWPVFGADSEPRWIVLNRAARQASEAKDYTKLRETLAALQPLLPGNPRIVYKLAASDARLAHHQEALTELADLAAAGLIYDFKADEDFASLYALPRFLAVMEQVARNREPVAYAVPVRALPETDLLPEDLAYDRKTKRFLIASVTQSKIIWSDGKLFAKTDWPVMALRIDIRRRTLWAATGWAPHCLHCDPAGADHSALLAFQLDSGAMLRRLDSPVRGLLGDMTITRGGDLYVSEGIHGAVLYLKAGSSALERLDSAGEFPSPQTPALSADERTLYVPDYVRGIAAVDLKSRAVRWLQPAPNIILSGIDGFYRYRDCFLAVQNGVTPERLLLLSADLSRQRILETNTPGLGEPTHGTFIGGSFYFITNTGWDQYGDDGKKKADSPPIRSEIRRIDLRRLQP